MVNLSYMRYTVCRVVHLPDLWCNLTLLCLFSVRRCGESWMKPLDPVNCFKIPLKTPREPPEVPTSLHCCSGLEALQHSVCSVKPGSPQPEDRMDILSCKTFITATLLLWVTDLCCISSWKPSLLHCHVVLCEHCAVCTFRPCCVISNHTLLLCHRQKWWMLLLAS